MGEAREEDVPGMMLGDGARCLQGFFYCRKTLF